MDCSGTSAKHVPPCPPREPAPDPSAQFPRKQRRLGRIDRGAASRDCSPRASGRVDGVALQTSEKVTNRRPNVPPARGAAMLPHHLSRIETSARDGRCPRSQWTLLKC